MTILDRAGIRAQAQTFAALSAMSLSGVYRICHSYDALSYSYSSSCLDSATDSQLDCSPWLMCEYLNFLRYFNQLSVKLEYPRLARSKIDLSFASSALADTLVGHGEPCLA